MNCPNCNAETAAATGECPVCGDSVTSAPTVAVIGRLGRPLHVSTGLSRCDRRGRSGSGLRSHRRTNDSRWSLVIDGRHHRRFSRAARRDGFRHDEAADRRRPHRAAWVRDRRTNDSRWSLVIDGRHHRRFSRAARRDGFRHDEAADRRRPHRAAWARESERHDWSAGRRGALRAALSDCPPARDGRDGCRVSGLGRGAGCRCRLEGHPTRDCRRSVCDSSNRAPIQAGIAARTQGHTQERRPHLRPGRNPRHQVHHDVVSRWRGPGDSTET